ncbi:MAG: phycobiliprotein lyase [Leptolyngbya sp. SIO3F4]|nr:phycobiliprotein lyase [Leptolyngbya sp. SIO3F4]
MSSSVITTPTENLETLATRFFEQSVGQWISQRRYYTLKNGEAQEVVSNLSIEFLDGNHPELLALAEMHNLELAMVCGVKSSWESNYISPSRKQATGSTIFGIHGNVLYRDRGFATTKPVTATYQLRDLNTMQLHTEYGGSAFDEELKLVGDNHRTRQTIISRAGQEIMVGQYLETRA